MDTERYIVAVEIGSSKITGAIGTRSLKGVVTVLGVDTEPLTGSVKRGFVVNPDEGSRFSLPYFTRSVISKTKAVVPPRCSPT